MSGRVKTPRKSSIQGRERTRRSETPQTIAEGDEAGEAPSTSETTARGQAPTSPGQKVRMEEKEELQNLNSRLAAYIDRVRSLQDENNRLSVQVRSKEEVITREVNAVKVTYEKELNDCKNQLDAVVKERASLQVEKRSLKAQNQELQEQLQRSERDLMKRDQELSAAQNRINELTNEAAALRAEADRAKSDKQKASEKLREALNDLESRKKEVADLRNACNEADMRRVETEAELQRALDKLELGKNVHEKQLKEVRASKQVEISEVDSRLQKEYESRLEDSIAELREYYEDLLARGREEADRVYEEKVNNLKSDFDRKLADAQSNREEVRQIKTRLDIITRRLREKEDESKTYEERVRELEMLLENEKERYNVMVGEKNDTIAHLQKQVDDIMKQLQDLMEENVRLDMEIATYRNLLEGEESRLNLTPGPEGSRPRRTRVAKLRTPASASRMESMASPLSRLWPLSRSQAASGAEAESPLKKRKRTFQSMAEEEESVRRNMGADGDLEITEVDPNGDFVRIRNKGQNDITMSGYALKHKATGTAEEGSEDVEIVFKFPRTILKAGSMSSIWSGNTSVTHQAPDNLKMNKKWTIGKEMKTVLVDSSDTEVAWFQLIHDHATRATAVTSTLRGDEELHHQRGDPQQCCVM